MEPRPIAAKNIRPGDRVSVRRPFDRDEAEPGVTTEEFTVTSVSDAQVRSRTRNFNYVDGIWTLLNRPAPKPAVGSRWRCELSDTSYVFTSGGEYYCYAGKFVGIPYPDTLGQDIALTPIPDHDDAKRRLARALHQRVEGFGEALAVRWPRVIETIDEVLS